MLESDPKFISVFTPSQTDSEDLEAILVQRQDLLSDAVERVVESTVTANKQHLLYVGPRGSGKTHFVTLLVHRLGQKQEVKESLRIAWLNEDETSTSVLELLIKTHQALVKRYPKSYAHETIEPAFELAKDRAQDFVLNRLLDSLEEDKTILIVVENLDSLFKDLTDVGQKKLRAILQEHPRFAIVATAQCLIDELKDRQDPFFGFFQTHHLKPLTEEDAKELLSNIAILNGQGEVAKFLQTAKGRSRIRALHHLSGGNHRMYIVLSQFISKSSIDVLVPPFKKMVDELTPYYQERLRWLPAQQRKIVELLSTRQRTVTVKELATRLFASHQTISSQLKDLREKGYVVSSQRGRESLYEIKEPLMRICLEVKQNQSHEPMALLVDFIRVWYDVDDLKSRLRNVNEGSLEQLYLLSAIVKNLEEEREKLGQIRKEKLGKLDYLEDLHMRTLLFSSLGSDQQFKYQEIEEHPLAEVFQKIPKATMMEPLKGIEAQLTKTIEDNALSVAEIAKSLNSRGFTYELLDDVEKALADYTTIIQGNVFPVEMFAMALCNRGSVYRYVGDLDKSIKDYFSMIRLENTPDNLKVFVNMNIAKILFVRGAWGDGIEYISEGLKLVEQVDSMMFYDLTEIVAEIYKVQLSKRHQLVAKLTQLYAEYNQALSVLGMSLIKHLGILHQSSDMLSSKNLEDWSMAWEEASKGITELQVPMRIFRVGVNFLKGEAKDEGKLLDLVEDERRILKQVFKLKD